MFNYFYKKRVINNCTFSYTRQVEMKGLGHAILTGKFQGKRFDCGSVDGFVEATNYFYEQSKK